MYFLKWKHTDKIGLFFGKAVPEYVILSYTWGNSADEITFGDLMDGDNEQKAELAKILFVQGRLSMMV